MKTLAKSKLNTNNSSKKEMDFKFKNLPTKGSEKSKEKNLGLSMNRVTSIGNTLGINKSILSSFRPGVINNVVGRKFKTGKNSRKYALT